ncbi:RNA polymerase-associated protein Rtf1 [Thelohanellus kitauei]|uniref:RNA polymerase-associated protein Rtf1 n=1 Tax=Thelohanellus kitauei TaxID=669202 RepID=A0A0C2NEQ5_THEKT|nr:RNA polymerase-associated protein Rtf1 [Thelohanellus kitauei]
MSFISNQRFTNKEFDTWFKQHKDLNAPLPKISEIKEKQEDLMFCSEYKLSSADIDKMVAEKQKFEEIPKNYAVLRKKIENELDLASMEGDESRATKLKEELAVVVREYDKLTEQTAKRMNVLHISHERRLKELNDREKLIEQECLNDKNKGDDPFTRRRTAPSMIEVFIFSLSF